MTAGDPGSGAAQAPPIRVFVVDDHELVRRGLRDLLEGAGDIEVVGEAASADEAKRRVLAVRPDVALLDVKLPDGSGVDVCRWVQERDPGIRVLIVTTYDDPEARSSALSAGASGFVLKEIRGHELVNGVRRAASGLSPIDGVVPAASARAETDPRLRHLTHQERRVLDLIVEGLTNREIGARLGIGEKTVRNHVTHLLGKLGLTRRTQAAVFALRHTGPGQG